MHLPFIFFLLLTFCVQLPNLFATDIQTDICIYGATPGGISAALAAAKSGREVVLIEPTKRIGGMTTSGLSHTDFHSLESLTGAFLHFSQQVKAYYVKNYGADSEQVKTSFEGTFGEPKVNLMIFEEMLAAYPKISIHRETVLTRVTKAASRLTEVHFESNQGSLNVKAQVFIDGTYEGDLMALAGVTYHVGREGWDVYSESLAPEKGDHQLQAYNFRFCATNDPANRVPIVAPNGYEREDFLGLIPILKSGEVERVFGYPSRCIVKAQTPPLPNQKYDINDVSRGLVRLSMPGKNTAWPEGDAATRQRIFEEHLRYNVGLLYFLQNDEAVPAKFQKPAQEWGWCRDEFTETNHLPPQLYVREARRMTGEYVYTQADSEHAPDDARAKLHKDAIAMGDYGNNCHGTSHEGPLFGGKHVGEFYNPVPPYQIPYGTLVPKENECNNLLVPVAVSSSHVGFCALRLEPIWMSLGQAAGHAAAMAADQEISVQKVSVPMLQQHLHEDGSATIYVSDVLPGHPMFESVQWWSMSGGLHGLNPMPEKPGQRGKNLHGQYYEANPGQEAALNQPLDEATRQRWLNLAQSLLIANEKLSQAATRGEFIKAAFAERD